VRIVVTGCAAQTQAKCSPKWPRSIASSAMTTRCAARPGATRARRSTRGFGIEASEKIAVADIMAVREMAPHLLDGFRAGLPRVFVQVQNGCDHRCTFCIIPYGRGNSRSVPMGAVVDQVRALVERGHAEIVLTGVDLTSYGADLPGHAQTRSADQADIATCARIEAPADFIDRFHRGRSRFARCYRGR
jgi:threonylcarbamoyladenosine tRNA methylthiotransferase MtaB